MAALEVAGEKKPMVGAVEVQKDPSDRAWWNAHVVDISGKEKLLCGFEGDVWRKQEFHFSCVRKLPKFSQADFERFNPRIGDEVELRVNATEHQPSGWVAALVKNIKHTFYFVARVVGTGADGQSEAIVEKSMLRPVVKSRGLEDHAQDGSIQQESFKFNPTLREWAETEDALGCFARIEADAGLMFIKVGRSELKLAGDTKAVRKAKMLLDVHQKHQIQIQTHMEKRDKRLTDLEKRRNRIEGTGYQHSIEITIDPSFVPRIIGAKGEAIRAVMQKYEVNIHIPDPEPDSRDGERIVRIFGNSMENIEKARGEVEFVEEAYPEPVDGGMYSWIRGARGRFISELKQRTGIVYARMDRDSRQMLMCGTRNAVDDAMAMFETHVMYYPVFSQMDEEMAELVKQLEEYGDYSARKEWRWWFDDEEEEDTYGSYAGYGGKSSGSKGGKSKGGKGSKGSSGKDKDKGEGKEGGKDGKDGKDGKGKGKDGKGKSKAWEEEDTRVAARPSKLRAWEEEDTRVASRSSKDGSKGRASGKDWGKGSSWQHEEEEEEEAWEDHSRSRGRGRPSRGASSKEEEDRPAVNRRMGKKGIRQ